jgi:hypothetical protein
VATEAQAIILLVEAEAEADIMAEAEERLPKTTVQDGLLEGEEDLLILGAFLEDQRHRAFSPTMGFVQFLGILLQ